MVAEAYMGRNFFNLYLKDRGYSVVQTNILPTAGNAVSIVAAFIFGWLSDASGSRLLVVNIVQAIVLVSNIIMVVWHVPETALMAAFYLAYVGSAAQPVVIVSGHIFYRVRNERLLTKFIQSWGHEITQHNANLRQLLVATGNIFTYAFGAWVPGMCHPCRSYAG